MAIIRLAATDLYELSATKKYTLGQRFILPATTLMPTEREFMYVQLDNGTGNLTATSNDVVVPYNPAGGGKASLYKYTPDKSDMKRHTGRRAAVLKAKNFSGTTNIYGIVQIRGYTHIDVSGSASIVTGQQLAATGAGTDKVAEPVDVNLTVTTADLYAIQNVFAEAVVGSLTWTTVPLLVNLYGF